MMASATVTWSSSDTSVATVDASGLVTGVGEGMATITASAGSGQGTAEITVMDLERAALVALYEATDGPNWVDAENWLTDAPLGEWYGVDTDNSGRVVRLDLDGRWDSDAREYIPQGLSGPVPSELGSLADLESLHLGGNDLTGPIPPEFGELASLTWLSLGSNSLTGPIPPEFGELASLTWLSLGSNSLTGPIPPELGRLADLESLNLGDNDLTGPIPPELGRLADLESLNLGDNDLAGPIPPEFGELASLTWLSLSSNSLTGAIPSELGRLADLESLYLGGNDLTGPIPESFLDLEALERFDFERNADLCAPGTTDFVTWLEGIEYTSGPYCNESDRGALNLLYETSGGPDWTNSGGWLETPALDQWYGVTANSLGRIVTLDLTRNGLAGALPASLGNLAEMTALRVGDNALAGRLPLTLALLSLVELQYADTDLCVPAEVSFQTWLNGISAHEGTGMECAPPLDREILVALYEATDGPNWHNTDNWLTDAPLRDWYGVGVDGQGRVVRLILYENNLAGPIPRELANLDELQNLGLRSNDLSGPIPSELGKLSNLTELILDGNALTGSIPPELGNLANLKTLSLGVNALEGPIPPELGRLASVEGVLLWGNALTGPIPPELGNLASLSQLWLDGNKLSGPIPPELGNLVNVTQFNIFDNALTGPLPGALGSLSTVEDLILSSNALTGPVPPEFGGMSSLKQLALSNNAGMEGALPAQLTSLRQLEALLAGDTGLCVSSDPGIQTWLARIHKRRIKLCDEGDPAMAYLTQAVQSREFPVPLIAGEKALLRVFPTARQATSVGIPAVRARFYVNGRETHVVDIPGKSSPIPTEVDESNLTKSANAEIPGHVVQPGLEMVVEVDPDGMLDPTLEVEKRIPETGRLAVDVRAMPLFDLTLIPFVWTQTNDESIADLVGAMAADPENHELLQDTRTLMPVGTLDVQAHEPVLSSSNSAFAIRDETKAIRAMEGGSGHYMGMMARPVTGAGGVAFLPGRSSFSLPVADIIAHELGHNMNLKHAPCGTTGDASYPYPDGSIGVWGYDFRDDGSLVHPSTPDLMSYCGPPNGISDYNFTNALRYRLFDEGPPAEAIAASSKSLLLWGGISADSVPFLEPAFVVEASTALPDSVGEYLVSGRTTGGDELFSLSFTMPEVADGDGSSSFAFVLPAQPGWESNLASITLDGPGGSFTLDGDSDLTMAILRNPRTRQVRGILRDLPQADAAAALAPQAGPDSLDVLFSRGIPDAAAWSR